MTFGRRWPDCSKWRRINDLPKLGRRPISHQAGWTAPPFMKRGLREGRQQLRRALDLALPGALSFAGQSMNMSAKARVISNGQEKQNGPARVRRAVFIQF